MFKYFNPAWAEINIDNVIHNIKEIRRVAKSKEIISVVKADAYGHGAVELAPILLQNGADRLAVALLSEALQLRESGVKAPILIFGYTPLKYGKGKIYDNAADIINNELEVTVLSYDYAKKLSKVAKELNKNVKVHIKVDTGMGRIGFLPTDESEQEIYKISKLPNIIIEGLYSHFSTADEKDKNYSNEQFRRYLNFYNKLKNRGVNINIKHIANSAALIDLPYTHLDAVRPGIVNYGYYPSADVNHDIINLKPTMTLKCNVVACRTLKKGSYIGYGRTFRTLRTSQIATLGIGYDDGYNRLLSNTGKIIVRGKKAPIVGRICMDMCMSDVTGIDDVKVGDEVILIGESSGEKIAVEDLAEYMGTIPYEVTAKISKRVPRHYIKDNKLVKIVNKQ
ncbi:alanine racemase [Clostridium sp. P21]|uniref:Alanine racemase n=1 Tax=Clostridium muellerianum TaxID=2716538 RepID=A0A7Y0EM28_9CLOT|nr:alanine racemase [Clostridium muellerianum]NMM65960.1 alanine racemase [Clostridium muellerianum]